MISMRSEEGRGPLASSTSNELVHSPQRISYTSHHVSSSPAVLADRALSTVPRRGPCPFPPSSLSFSSILRGTCPAAALRTRRFNVAVVPTFASRVDRFLTTRAVASTCRRATRLYVRSRKARCLCHRNGRTIRRCRRHGWRCWIPTPDTRTTGIRSRTSPRTIDQEKTRRCRRHLLRQDRRRTKKG